MPYLQRSTFTYQNDTHTIGFRSMRPVSPGQSPVEMIRHAVPYSIRQIKQSKPFLPDTSCNPLTKACSSSSSSSPSSSSFSSTTTSPTSPIANYSAAELYINSSAFSLLPSSTVSTSNIEQFHNLLIQHPLLTIIISVLLLLLLCSLLVLLARTLFRSIRKQTSVTFLLNEDSMVELQTKHSFDRSVLDPQGKKLIGERRNNDQQTEQDTQSRKSTIINFDGYEFIAETVDEHSIPT